MYNYHNPYSDMENAKDQVGQKGKSISEVGMKYGEVNTAQDISAEKVNSMWNSQAKGPKEWRPEIVD
jgi:hypothetical protein